MKKICPRPTSPRELSRLFASGKKIFRNKKLDSRGIEPRTTPMLREYYTTKPQAQLLKIGRRLSAQGGLGWSGSAR